MLPEVSTGRRIWGIYSKRRWHRPRVRNAFYLDDAKEPAVRGALKLTDGPLGLGTLRNRSSAWPPVLMRFARVFLVPSGNQTVDNKSVFSDNCVCSLYRPGHLQIVSEARQRLRNCELPGNEI